MPSAPNSKLKNFNALHHLLLKAYPQVPSEYTLHMPRVHKRVLKLVNFEVQKVQKPDVCNLETHSS